MTSYTQDGTVGPWAKEKLECLAKYLSAYTTILMRQKWCEGYVYVDAFAGAGSAPLRVPSSGLDEGQLIFDVVTYHSDDEERVEYVRGSPGRALDIPNPFTHYIFIERNPTRAKELENVRSEHPEIGNITIAEGDANDVLIQDLINGFDWRRFRAVVFLDPFGLQVPWSTISGLAETNAVEVIVNFPVGMAIQRLLPRSGEISEKHRATLNRYLGSNEWENVIYVKTPDLFGEKVDKAEGSGHQLAIWYRKRLKDAFGYASSPRLIRNSRGGHLYYLIFAGPNRTGARIAEHVLGQGEIIR